MTLEEASRERCSRLVADLHRRYPHARRYYRDILREKGRGRVPDWPSWCYVPLAGAVAVVSDDNAPRPDQAFEIGRVGALAAWAVRRGIWPVTPLLSTALAERGVPEDVAVAALYRLPEPGLYLELPNEPHLLGSFVHLEFDVNTRRPELRLLLDTDGTWNGLYPVALFLDQPSLTAVRRGPYPPEIADALLALDGGVTVRIVAAVLHLTTHLADTLPSLEHAL